MNHASWIDKTVFVFLTFAILFDGGMYLYLKRRPTENPESLYRFDGERGYVASPVGFTSSGVKVQGRGQKKPGWVIRYASRTCHYCSEDESLWNPLSAELQKLGYEVYVVLPDSKVEFPAGNRAVAGTHQEAFVDTAWVRRFRLSKTPTLMIFDAKRGLVWCHQGTLGESDPEAALKALRATGNS